MPHAASTSLASNPAPESSNAPIVENLASKVDTVKLQLFEILSLLKDQQSPVPTTLEPSGAPPALSAVGQVPASAETLSTPEVYKAGLLQFTLPPPSSDAIAKALSIRAAYAETGKLNRFTKPATVSPFTSKRFIPTPDGLSDRIKEADTRDGLEAELLWNIGNSQENTLSATHKVAEPIKDGDTTAITDASSVCYHYLQAGYERTQERIDFFADSLESGKSDAILLQKYLREYDHPYGSSLFRNTKSKFAEVRTQAYAKDYNKQQPAGGRKGNTNLNNNNNNNNNKGNNNNSGWKNNNNNRRNKPAGAGAAPPPKH